jgi:hypothetical protein
MANDDDSFKAMTYWALVLRIPDSLRQTVLNFLENQNVRILYQTTNHSPLRIVRTGTPERFSEAIRQ